MAEVDDDDYTIIGYAADIVAAYVSHNSVTTADLPGLILSIHAALTHVSQGGGSQATPEAEPLRPAVPVKKSVTNEFIICLEDGKKFKSLKRHLRTHYDMSPDEYRAKWGLPNDYPMVAPSYAEVRSNLAKQTGLGQQRRRAEK